MDSLDWLIPGRDSGEVYAEKLTPVSSDVFISIPDRDFYSLIFLSRASACLKLP
jgi:hypothetical protein